LDTSDLLKQLTAAPKWALFTGTAGWVLINAAVVLFLLGAVLWLLQPRNPKFAKLAKFSFFGGCFSILGMMAALESLFIANQFEYQYVFSHGDNLTGLGYKIAGVWTAQEGSFLLWACGAAIFGMLAFRFMGEYRRWYGFAYSLFLAPLCAILAYDSPFGLTKGSVLNGVVKLPHSGLGMTPALQNYWVIIHPPIIFTGFGSLTVMFALSVAAMLSGNVSEWIRIVRPWALISASILGLGLCTGGMWAYETQGWGGFWGWDPVEMVSFVPWIFTISLIHGIIVQTAKKRWIGTNLILGGVPFLTFVYGTFLTRSGLLDKVSNHSFAEMDRVSLIVLVSFMIATTLAFFALYFVKGTALAKQSAPEPDAPGIDREGLYRSGILLMSLLATGVAIGMSWPWFSALRTGTGAAIEEKQYHLVIVWFFVPIILLMAIAPFVGWRKLASRDIFNRLVSVLSVSAGLTGFALVAIQNPKFGVHMTPGMTVAMPFHYRMSLMPWMAFLIFLCTFTAVSNIWKIIELFKKSKMGIGGFVSHIGVAVLLTGLIISRGFEQKDGAVIIPNRGPQNILGYSIAFKKLDQKTIDDRDGKIIFSVDGPDGQHFDAPLGLYYYPGEDGAPTAMIWPVVLKHLSHDFYMAMNKPEMYAWQKPLDFKEGETRIIKSDAEDDSDPGMEVTYKKFVMQGNPGQAGTKFCAVLHIKDGGHEYDVTPTLMIADGAPEHDLPPVGNDYRMALLAIDPADRSVQLQLMFSPPLYPVILFYKPMTILVWVGTGIMTFGGLLSAFYRRASRPA